MMKHCIILRLLTCTLALALYATGMAQGVIYSDRVNTLQVTVDDDFLSPIVVTMGKGQKVKIEFDEMSHDIRRLTYHITHCNPDWTPTTELIESDWMEGFNDVVIDNAENSINTTMLYTHYDFTIPNEQCRLKLSGNYIITVTDEDNDEKLLEARVMVVDQKTNIAMSVSSNTDIDVNKAHQQLTLELNYNGLNVTYPERQIYTIFRQNDSPHQQRTNVTPDIKNINGMAWRHNKNLIFDGGNEYRQYETLALTHPTMGLSDTGWDGHNYTATPYDAEPRPNYVFEEDTNGAFYVRNSDNIENKTTCDYMLVNYKLYADKPSDKSIIIDGQWTTHADKNKYIAKYDEQEGCYRLTLLQKQGYYAYRYLCIDSDGTTETLKSEGNFHETENQYQAYVYYKDEGGRYWQLVGYRQLDYSSRR